MFLNFLHVLCHASARPTFGVLALFSLLHLPIYVQAHVFVLIGHGNKYEPASKTGSIEISTQPGGYPLFIDGVRIDETTDYVRLLIVPPGQYKIEIQFPDVRWSQVINVVAGRKTCIALNYRPRTIEVPAIAASPCPYPVNITAPAQVKDGDIVTFTADVGYQGPSALNYTWTVSPLAARILSGAGTPTITVDSSGFGGRRITATLIVDDGSGNSFCRQSAQAGTSVGGLSNNSTTRRFDEFLSIAHDDDKERFDYFAIELQNNPGVTGYVIAYAGRNSRAGEADRMTKRAADYLTATRGIGRDRLVFINGGRREISTFEMWIMPQGAEPPRPTPTIIPDQIRDPGKPSQYESGSDGIDRFDIINSVYGGGDATGRQGDRARAGRSTVQVVDLGDVTGTICDCGTGNSFLANLHARIVSGVKNAVKVGTGKKKRKR